MLNLKFLNKLNLYSQNLITNGSFELLSQCPFDANQVNFVEGWINPTTWGTPDLYNECSSIVGIPSYCNCDYAFQYAKTGSSYVGIYTYGFSVPDGREYIQTQLNSILEENKCYKVSFFVNLLNGSKYATNNLDIHFSSNPISSNLSIINLTPNIPSNKIISDTLNWVEISGIYEATGGEVYITIGNFKNDAETNTINVNENTISDAAYYLIDDVSVIPVSDLPNSMPAYAGKDISILLGDSTFIGQEISNLNCTWSILDGAVIANNTSGLWVKPTEPTAYLVEQNLCGVITKDTVYVGVHHVGLGEKEKDFVKVFPNPNKGSFELDVSGLQNQRIELFLFDNLGRKLLEQKSETKNGKIQLHLSLESGIYLLRIETENGSFEEKVVVR